MIPISSNKKPPIVNDKSPFSNGRIPVLESGKGLASIFAESLKNTDIAPVDSKTQSVDDFITMLNKNYGGALRSYDSIQKLIQYLAYLSNGDSDALTSATNTYLQYLIGEQNYKRDLDYAELNYERSLAPNQVALMQSAGMSRAAALSALQGGSTPQTANSQTAVNPSPTSIEQNRIAKEQLFLDYARSAAYLAQQLSALAQTPFDIQAKDITNKIMSSQSDMLSLQLEGMQDAAMFLQAVANADNGDVEHTVANLPVNDQISYFDSMSGKAYKSSDKVSSWEYANSESFARARKNPFFWATINDQIRAKNHASASVFEPERAAAEVSQLRAAVSLAQNQAFNEKMSGVLLKNQAFIDECTVQLRKDIEIVKSQAEKLGYQFDEKRAQAFLSRVSTFNNFDFLRMDYEIERLASIKDPVVFQKQKDALTASLDYQVANYLYGSSIASLKSGTLQSMMTTDENGKSFPSEDLYKWSKSYLQFNELGYNTEISSKTDVARTVFSGITAASALGFVGYKVLNGIKAMKTAATAASAAFGEGSSVALPFNSLAPLVIPAPELLKQTIMPYSFGGSAAQPEIY